MTKMRAIQVSHPHGPLELVKRDIPEPSYGTVRVKVHACGVCHSDSFVKEGVGFEIQYPRIPGHEVAGVIDKIGSGVETWKVGQKVGVGWHGGYCFYCNACRHGDFINCRNMKVCGVSYDGGYADYMIAPVTALALIPDELSFVEAAPLMCAGITTFNALRNSGARPGDLVAVLGVGGLGHLAVQFCSKMGFNTFAIARGKEKEAPTKKLGARHYLDSESQDVAAELQKYGGAKVLLSTITQIKAVQAVMPGISVNGKLLFVGIASDPLELDTSFLIRGKRCLCGWASGSSIDSQETMFFCAQTGIRSINEIYPLERAAEAYDHMMSGKAHFRAVLTMDH
jgi:D-arabinose 1-dehydrogenase-like Zn-dependent alcohol dehydrogenase